MPEKIQAISYFIDNKDFFINREEKKLDQIIQRQRNLILNAKC